MGTTHEISPQPSTGKFSHIFCSVRNEACHFIIRFRMKVMKLARQFCFEGMTRNATGRFLDDYLDDDIWETYNDITPAFNETFAFCKLFNKRVDCAKLFFPQITEKRLCYSFNSLNVRDMFTDEWVFFGFEKADNDHGTVNECTKILVWFTFSISSYIRNMASDQPSTTWDLQSGYSTHSKETYPYHAHDTGLRSSLTVILKVRTADVDYLCTGGPRGFVVALHPPHEIAQMYKRYFYVPLQESVLLAVTPTLVETAKRVRAMDLSVRECYLNSERQLRFYKHYSEHNCRYIHICKSI